MDSEVRVAYELRDVIAAKTYGLIVDFASRHEVTLDYKEKALAEQSARAFSNEVVELVKN